jgi:hypothetical protein
MLSRAARAWARLARDHQLLFSHTPYLESTCCKQQLTIARPLSYKGYTLQVYLWPTTIALVSAIIMSDIFFGGFLCFVIVSL